jgi:hypothetical protein
MSEKSARTFFSVIAFVRTTTSHGSRTWRSSRTVGAIPSGVRQGHSTDQASFIIANAIVATPRLRRTRVQPVYMPSQFAGSRLR